MLNFSGESNKYHNNNNFENNQSSTYVYHKNTYRLFNDGGLKTFVFVACLLYEALPL